MKYRMESACYSRIGYVRNNNEDNFLFYKKLLKVQNHGLYFVYRKAGILHARDCLAVFDGMGGEYGGEIASYTAADILKGELICDSKNIDYRLLLENSCLKMNARICEKMSLPPEDRMGTTAVILLFGNEDVHLCNLGDSRAYRLKDDCLEQLSYDHTDKRLLELKGIKGRKPILMQYLGVKEEEMKLEPYYQKLPIEAGNKFLLCSDGLTDMVSDEQIKVIMTRAKTARKCAKDLVNTALKNGGKDNVTVIVSYISHTGR